MTSFITISSIDDLFLEASSQSDLTLVSANVKEEQGEKKEVEPIAKAKAGKKRKRSTKAPEPTYFDEIVESLKARGRKKKKLTLDEGVERPKVEMLIRRMEEAASADVKAEREGNVAVCRLKMLDEVQSQVQKCIISDLMLQCGILHVMGLWLQSSTTDGPLPDVQIRTTLYILLARLSITTQALRDSNGLDRILMRMHLHDEEAMANRTVLGAILQRTIREVSGQTTNIEEGRAQEILAHHVQTSTPMVFDFAIRPAVEDDDENIPTSRNAHHTASGRGKGKVLTTRQAMEKRMAAMKRGSRVTGSNRSTGFRVDQRGRV